MPLTPNKSVLLLNPFKYSAAFLVKSVQEKNQCRKNYKFCLCVWVSIVSTVCCFCLSLNIFRGQRGLG